GATVAGSDRNARAPPYCYTGIAYDLCECAKPHYLCAKLLGHLRRFDKSIVSELRIARHHLFWSRSKSYQPSFRLNTLRRFDPGHVRINEWRRVSKGLLYQFLRLFRRILHPTQIWMLEKIAARKRMY